eukprot:comp16700_c0_seq1/m.14959 comp16700_c0_seq1/g.14959  ORF comp16700_c0_seq1/g.14959 comp16700_c0_seq1/m.14959 type:complete len:148 (-) comp16700_c0_seq1:326-769(-)
MAATSLVEGCVFCKIAAGQDPTTQILKQTEHCVVFRDIHPAAAHHYLAVPKQHITDARALQPSHIALVEELQRVAVEVVREQGGPTDDLRLGFHWPPLVLIGHLHLHAIAPASSLSFPRSLLFRPTDFLFVSPKWVLDDLRARPAAS